jgi:16S rRNA (cytosine967-C5)-methyltransferase
MIAPARRAAFDFLCRIEMQMAHSDNVLHSAAASELQPVDRNLVTEIVYGTLRWRGWLDHVLGKAVSRPWQRVEPEIRIVLRLSLYQLARMDRIPAHAAINDAVELTRRNSHSGAAGFVNGVLRNLIRQKPWLAPDFHRDCPAWVRASLPAWLWERWQARFGMETAFEYAVALNRPPQNAFRYRCKSLPVDAAGVRPSELVPDCFISEAATLAGDPDARQVQDEASQLIPFLLGQISGSTVWDACAAPGGKSSILIARCLGNTKVFASDMSEERAQAMKRFLGLCGGGVPQIVVADVRRPAPFRIAFDAILADVPCSGTGTLRRNPEIKWRLQPERLDELGHNQGRILESVAASLKNGGRLLYSTCSTEPEENEQVVTRFLMQHPEFRLERPDFPPGIENRLDGRGFFRSFPSPRLWDGFFAALMVKSG